MAGTAQASDGGSVDAGFTCKRPRVLIVLDKSSSMVTGYVGTLTKWEVAKSAISSAVTTYESSIDFGLLVFPNPSQCGWGKVVVGVGPKNAQAIIAQLVTPPPQAGNWTPMAQSLDVAATVQNLQDKNYSNNVLLITDGWQWCDPYDAKTRFLPVNSTAALTQKGITTHVVGFGDAVDVLTLNKMADAAKNKISSSCDVNSQSLTGNNCYYQASQPQDLLNALKKIALNLTAEQCDNLDNDCNGKVDDKLTRACQTICGYGVETCTTGTWGGCTAAKPETEKCDGFDNDCNGTIDEGCACQSGATRSCGSDLGECVKGTQTCVAGVWSACTGEVKSEAEKCDTKDNDCNGLDDDGLSRTCSTKCGSGNETCVAGSWANCTAPQPTQEICDGLDNDCDGTKDGPNAKCSNGGVCQGGICVSLPEAPNKDFGPSPDAPGGTGFLGAGGETGCDCRLASPPGAAEGLALLALVLLGWRRRQTRP